MPNNNDTDRASELLKLIAQETENTPDKSGESDGIDDALSIIGAGRSTSGSAESFNGIPDSIVSHISDSAESESAQADTHTEAGHFLELEGEDGEPEPEPEPVTEKRESKSAAAAKSAFRLFGIFPKAVVYIACVLIISAFLSYYAISIISEVMGIMTNDRGFSIEISENATDEDVAKLLEENGNKSAWLFRLYMKYHGRDNDEATKYVPGKHELNENMNYSQLISALTVSRKVRETVRITVPEGYTVDQIIDLLVEKGVGTRENYVDAINNFDFASEYKYEFLKLLDEGGYPETRKYRLEGYLYPDTYDFYTDEKESRVISKFLSAFNSKFWSYYKRYCRETFEKNYPDMSFDDLVTLASMIQSEGGTVEDFEYISSVFHNRLANKQNFPKLESDATIQYVLPERIKDSTQLDVSYDSPYNTYLYDGLPPGAISNPGTDALMAAVFPVSPMNGRAYFFVSNNAGKTYYAQTLAAHNKNVARVKKENAEIEAGTYVG